MKPLDYEPHTEAVLPLASPGYEYQYIVKDSQAIAFIYLVNKMW